MLTELQPNRDPSMTSRNDPFVKLSTHTAQMIKTMSEPANLAPMSRATSRESRRWGRFTAATLTAAIALALAGCAAPVVAPSVEVPGNFAAAPATQDEPELAWWEGYGDPVLGDLIRRAAFENRDVKIAAERVRAARAGETISRSWLFPSVGVSATGADQRTGYGDPIKNSLPSAADAKSASAGIDVSWEIDISGRLRAGAAAAAADALATEDAARGVRLLVLSDVATSYFTLVGALRQLETMRAISAAQDETLRLVRARQRAGLATPFDVERAQTEASRARAAIPPLETLAAVSRHRIAVLIGDQAFNAASIVPWSGPTSVPAARAGQPAALLERRPDLLAAKAQLEAANARRQQAAAEWFPRLFLGAVFGRETFDVNSMNIGAARFSNAAALLAMPLFNAGRTRSINDIAESAQKEAVLRYEDGIVRALEDVENSLVALKDERLRADDLNSAATSAEAALGRAQSMYDRGQIDLLPLLDAQRVRLSVRLGANDSNTQLLLDSVRLYKALGGGWQAFEPAPSTAGRNPSPLS
jgi:NodT family efflux transporter outer membrane factor (OMF) lipoprotein